MEELLASTSSLEIAEWMAYEQLEPFSDTKAEFRNAVLCQALMLVNGAKGVDLKSFMIDWDKPWREEKISKSVEQEKLKISSSIPKSKKDGIIVCYDGEAPPIKRIGSRGKPTPAKRRLQEILHGKSR